MSQKKQHHKRKHVICLRCNEYKMHFGLNMCSACLRHTKRETRPSFYLGTCYSEITRRCKHKDPLRIKYQGKKYCTKKEFFDRFLNDQDFLILYKGWQASNFQRGFAPSIDRIDNNGDYNIENLQFLLHSENTGKDSHNQKEIKWKSVIDNQGIIYSSIKECARINKSSNSNVRKYIETGKELNGKKYRFYSS